MKKLLLSISILGILTIIIPSQVDAIFQSIESNCLLKDGKYIDTCPDQRKSVKTINEIMYDIRTKEEAEVLGKNEMIALVKEKKSLLQKVDQKLYQSKTRTPNKTFTLQYMMHLMNLYIEELEKPGKLQGKIDKLFAITYFNQTQEGLIITAINPQASSQMIRQYDPSISLEINVRNYDKNIISNIEDIYCFATTGKKDYIFPLNIPINIFDSNSIKTINIQLPTAENPIITNQGEQTLYCTIVYLHNDKEIYSPYFPFPFTILPA